MYLKATCIIITKYNKAYIKKLSKSTGIILKRYSFFLLKKKNIVVKYILQEF